jgi:MoaA/NifB/PqqE/SkfB family radical SAM enzyme
MTTSLYHLQKREAFESFFRFEDGEGTPQWPIEIFLEISNICDLKCAMCPTFSSLNPRRFANLRSADRGVMDIEQGTEPLESLLQRASVVHAHGYGEPTIHPEFKEFISYLSEYEVLIDFFTNGMHLTQDVCDLLVDKSIFRITVSFSGATAEEYNNVYIGGDFDKVLSGIQRLADTKEAKGSHYPRIDVNSIGFKHHVEQFPKFVRLMGEHGVNAIHLKPLSTYELIPELESHKAQADDQAMQMLEQARSIAVDYEMSLHTVPFETAPYELPESQPETQAVDIVDLKKRSREVVQEPAGKGGPRGIYQPSKGPWFEHDGTPCLEPFKTLYASFDGSIFPCCFKGSNKGLGKLDRDDAETIWNDDEFAGLRQGVFNGMYPAKLCGRCVRKSTFPKSHGIDRIVHQYARWFLETFGVPFHAHIQQRARQSRPNEEIVKRHSGSGIAAPATAFSSGPSSSYCENER